MELVEIEHQDNVAILRLNNGITNPLNLEFLQNISRELQKLKQDTSVVGLVLTGNNDKFFSIGFDIPKLYDASRAEFRTFYRTYNSLCMELYSLPKPLIAAITGHAIAGGCILTLCCDHRIIAEGRKLMGLNEVKLGVSVPYPGVCILQQVVGARNAREILEIGEFYEPDEALKMGMVDQVLPLEQVLPKAVEKAKILGELPNEAYQEIKGNNIETVEKQILKHLEEKEKFFIECWFSDDARERLEVAMKKF
ncbi:MAG: enoyl-CoA hydratase/isomerase family protein [Thermoplasmata archaeon]|nr:enoyl-CoA hydratase/isomerase family protein [Thermoplasmata archaeon]